MELVFDYTKKFEKDMRKFSPSDKERISERINRYAQMLIENEGGFYSQAYQPHKLKLVGGLDSSLYSLRISQDIRLILTVDEDPIFDQIVLTLLRVVRRDDLSKAFRSIAESLYQSRLVSDVEQSGEVNGAN